MRYSAMIATLALLLAALLAVLAWGGYRQIAKPPPFHFSSEVYLPVRTDLCPGDVVEFRPSLIVTRAPALIILARTLWSVAEQRTLVPDLQPKYFVWTEEMVGQPSSRTVKFRLPRDLPVGRYEIRGAAGAMNSDAAAYRVPVAIAETCLTKGAR